MAPERIREEVLALPISERAELAHLLIASLDEGADPDAEAAWDVELQIRVEEIQNGTSEGEPADDVFDALRH